MLIIESKKTHYLFIVSQEYVFGVILELYDGWNVEEDAFTKERKSISERVPRPRRTARPQAALTCGAGFFTCQVGPQQENREQLRKRRRNSRSKSNILAWGEIQRALTDGHKWKQGAVLMFRECISVQPRLCCKFTQWKMEENGFSFFKGKEKPFKTKVLGI